MNNGATHEQAIMIGDTSALSLLIDNKKCSRYMQIGFSYCRICSSNNRNMNLSNALNIELYSHVVWRPGPMLTPYAFNTHQYDSMSIQQPKTQKNSTLKPIKFGCVVILLHFPII